MSTKAVRWYWKYDWYSREASWAVCFKTHSGRVTHICVSKLSIIGSDSVFSPGRSQAIIWTKTGQLSIGPLGTSFGEISNSILTSSFKTMRFKMSSATWRRFLSRFQWVKFTGKYSSGDMQHGIVTWSNLDVAMMLYRSCYNDIL